MTAPIDRAVVIGLRIAVSHVDPFIHFTYQLLIPTISNTYAFLVAHQLCKDFTADETNASHSPVSRLHAIVVKTSMYVHRLHSFFAAPDYPLAP